MKKSYKQWLESAFTFGRKLKGNHDRLVKNDPRSLALLVLATLVMLAVIRTVYWLVIR